MKENKIYRCCKCDGVVSVDVVDCKHCGVVFSPAFDLDASDIKKVAFAKKQASGYIGSDFAKKASDEDILEMVKLKDAYAKIYNSKLLPVISQTKTLRKKYGLK